MTTDRTAPARPCPQCGQLRQPIGTTATGPVRATYACRPCACWWSRWWTPTTQVPGAHEASGNAGGRASLRELARPRPKGVTA
jgi:hypothetical protein